MLSNLDRKILYLLDEDARESIASIAKQLKVHRNVAQYHIDKLQEQGILQGTYAEVNILALGYRMHRIFLKLRNTTPKQEEQLLTSIAKKSEIIWLFKTQGEWDVDIVFATLTGKHTKKFIQEISNDYNHIIANTHVSEMVDIERFSRSYLYPDAKRTSNQAFQETSIDLDETDRQILQILATDARRSTVSIAQTVGLSAPATARRINQLKKDNIIRGFRAFINTEKTGHTYYKIRIDLDNYRTQDIIRVQQYLRDHNNIIYLTDYIGGATIECEAHFQNQQQLQSFTHTLKQQFGSQIHDINILIFTDEYVFRHAPKELF